jgi:hypothetical protein
MQQRRLELMYRCSNGNNFFNSIVFATADILRKFLYFLRFTDGKYVGGGKGGIRKVQVESLPAVYDTITESAMTLGALNKKQVKELLQSKMKEKKGLNSLASNDLVPLSNKTVDKYMEEMKATSRCGKTKPVSRVEPYLNIRNAISKAAGLTALSRACAVENMHSSDEVGLFLFGWELKGKRPKLVSTKEADAFLRKNNVSLSSVDEDDNQQRAAHIGATLQAHTGDITCFYLRIVDSNFPNTRSTSNSEISKPVIFCANKATNCYVVCCHPDVTDTVVEDYIGRLISHPAIFKKQDDIIARELNGPNETSIFGSQSQPSPGTAILPPSGKKALYYYYISLTSY